MGHLVHERVVHYIIYKRVNTTYTKEMKNHPKIVREKENLYSVLGIQTIHLIKVSSVMNRAEVLKEDRNS